MKQYERYKDSGVEWLGEVPEHWNVKRLGSWFSERKTKVSDKDYKPLSVTKQGILPQLESAAKSNDGDNRKLVLKGDFVINSRSDRKGSSGLSELDGSVSLINIVMHPSNINSRFSEYIFKSNSFVEEYYRNGHGIVADLWTTRFDEMKNISITYPPIEEQGRIVAFLDEKCGQIDRAVEQKERMIELLQERRAATIQRAVTQGLDPTLPLKDSTIDWIGKIPTHWQIKKLKYLATIKSGDSIINNQISESGKYEVYGGNGLMGYYNKFNVSDQTIIIGRVGALCGNVRYIKDPKFISDNALIVKCNSTKLYPYITILLAAVNLNSLSVSNAQPLITGTKVMNVTLPIPPLSEQKEIAAYLDKVSTKTEQSIKLKRQEIERLKEYRQTLINSAVTGKIKID